ncbi:secreted RxLR effector protein 161-like [Juglans microcarpa x Juglans regia]|uniref:secreted RxLR effector protein 161-like n=1 Tax=Juglans microcarpa x Juglans regia TaxID=2249226 RepID=UPI001B7E230D|nr:secreted RxLR effector protein 161-like [Juglans microcarpa x Juglans regia]
MLIAYKSKVEIDRLKTQLSQEFEMKDLGEAQRILGMEINKDKVKNTVHLTQKQYLERVLQRFNMNSKTKQVSTPIVPYFKLSALQSPKSDEERDYMKNVPYASVVGSLMYVIVCTQPDISQAISLVSRYIHNPGKTHWHAAKWILRYILGTVDLGLKFEKSEDSLVTGYVDLDYAGDLDKRRSTTGYVFTMAGGPVSWRSILQSTIALSSTEAKYMAVTKVMKEAIWLQGLVTDLGFK